MQALADASSAPAAHLCRLAVELSSKIGFVLPSEKVAYEEGVALEWHSRSSAAVGTAFCFKDL